MLNDESNFVNTPYFNGVYHSGRIQTKQDANGNEIVTTIILGREVLVKSFRGIPVLSFQDIAELLEPANPAPVYKSLQENFRNRSNDFRNGIDYFMLKPEHVNGSPYVISEPKIFGFSDSNQQVLMLPQVKSIGLVVNNRGTIYLTETGFTQIIRTMRHPMVSELIRNLIDGYFMARDMIMGISTPEQEHAMMEQIHGKEVYEYINSLKYIPLSKEESDELDKYILQKCHKVYIESCNDDIQPISVEDYIIGNTISATEMRLRDYVYSIINNKFQLTKGNLGLIYNLVNSINLDVMATKIK